MKKGKMKLTEKRKGQATSIPTPKATAISFPDDIPVPQGSINKICPDWLPDPRPDRRRFYDQAVVHEDDEQVSKRWRAL